MSVPPSSFARWFVRGAVALTIATPFILWSIGRALNGSHEYTFEVEASSSVEGSLQLFYDRGSGITEQESVRMPIHTGSVFQTIRWPISSGTFHVFRIDPPGIEGRYSIGRARILDWNNAVVVDIPAASITPAFQLRMIEPGPPVVYESPVGSNDPQLIWRPTPSLILPPKPGATAAVVLAGVGEYGAALLAVWLSTMVLGRLTRPAQRWLSVIARAGNRRPRRMIASASLLGTVIAMYPIVFLGESLVSPNNGGAVLLYNYPPFTPGEHDLNVENIRGSDNGAEMWGFVPYSQVQRLALSHGEIPLWNRYSAAGRPLWGQGQTQIMDPLHWVTLVTPNVALGWDIKFVLHRFVFAVGIGLAVLAITESWVAAASMAFVAPFASYFLFRLNHPAQFTFTYASWMMWAWFRLAAAATARDRAGAARWIAMTTTLVFVGSPPKEAAVVILCGYATGALACIGALRTQRQHWLRLRAGAMAGLIAALIAAPHWLIFLTTLRQSLTDYDVPQARFATWPFAQAIAFGALLPGQLLPGTHAVAVSFWIAALLVGGYTWRHPVRRAATLGPMLAFAVAFGVVPASIITSVPLLANVHQIDYAFIGAGIVLLMIAGGVGIAGLETASQRTVFTISAICVSSGALLIARTSGRVAALSISVETWALLFTVALGALLIPLMRRAVATSSPLAVVACASTILLLVIPNSLHTTTHIDRIDESAIQPRDRADFTVRSAAMEAIHQDARSPARTLGLGELLFPGTQALYGVEGLGGPDALELPRYEQLINASGVQRYWAWNQTFTAADLEHLGPLLDLLNVRYLVTGLHATSERVSATAPGITALPHEADRVLAMRRSSEWPRAFFVDHVESYADVAGFVRQMNGSARPFASIDETDEQARRLTANAPPGDGVAIPATNYRLTANRTRFRIQASRPGVAVLTEAWMANDFIATVNGRPTPYFRVNHAFKGVAIPAAGDWTIEFVYRPAWWWLSVVLGGIGVAGLAGFRVVIR